MITNTKKFLVGLFLLGFSVFNTQAQEWWGNNTQYEGRPWVENISKNYPIREGLYNKHLTVAASHGRFWKCEKNEWVWQRPHLYCTTEDLFTQTFVVPYLIPMLENAGAVVYSPRERDWQTNEAIVDNDKGLSQGKYIEEKGKNKWFKSDYPGFAHKKEVYMDGENPFVDGSARLCETTNNRKKESYAQWVPSIPEKGRYAVYVSYQSFNESVDDAIYTVFHKGGNTRFRVNQQIGNGTWVYLGTFDFDAGQSNNGMVVLSNYSKSKGVVSADAVRFGGGMGNIGRGEELQTSRLPRYLEGARYSAQWAGFPYPVYGKYEGTNDYNDDINVRSYTTNYLNGSSIFNPDSIGLRVPIELQLAVHSDAGYKADNSIVGSMTICSTQNDSIYNYPGGISRQASKELASLLLHNAKSDLDKRFQLNWVAREVRDRNYSESKRADVPSAIFETLSHQNFSDIKLGHDPNFKFTFARSMYKSVLQFISQKHHTDYTVEPLPIHRFAIESKSDNRIELSWAPTNDPLEPSAKPTSYILYTRYNNGGFDNGTLVHTNHLTMELVPGVIYSFKVTALNKGGESMSSEILSAMKAKKENSKTILIVNGFHRLSGPKPVESENELGFDLQTDAGVPYLYTPAFSGRQLFFDKKGLGREDANGTGFCGNELEGKLIAGNTFDYTYTHGEAIANLPDYSFVSCSKEAVEQNQIKLEDYEMVDFIMGLEKNDGWSLVTYKTFSSLLQDKITRYAQKGGRILVSGAYIGSDMQSTQEQQFTSSVLKYSFDTTLPTANHPNSILTGCGMSFAIPRMLNEKQYAVQTPDCIRPQGTAFPAFAFDETRQCAGIAFKNNQYRVMALSFPFESIVGTKEKRLIMSAILQFLLN